MNLQHYFAVNSLSDKLRYKYFLCCIFLVAVRAYYFPTRRFISLKDLQVAFDTLQRYRCWKRLRSGKGCAAFENVSSPESRWRWDASLLCNRCCTLRKITSFLPLRLTFRIFSHFIRFDRGASPASSDSKLSFANEMYMRWKKCAYG